MLFSRHRSSQASKVGKVGKFVKAVPFSLGALEFVKTHRPDRKRRVGGLLGQTGI